MEDKFEKGAFDVHPHRGIKPSHILLTEVLIIMIMRLEQGEHWKKGTFNL